MRRRLPDNILSYGLVRDFLHELVGSGLELHPSRRGRHTVGMRNVRRECGTKCLCVGNGCAELPRSFSPVAQMGVPYARASEGHWR